MTGAKPGRRWFPLDVGFYRDQRILEAGWPAAQLFIAMLSYLTEADARAGRMTREAVQHLGVSRWQTLILRLEKAGLVSAPDPDSYVVVAWDAWQTETTSARRTREYRERRRHRDVTP